MINNGLLSAVNAPLVHLSDRTHLSTRDSGHLLILQSLALLYHPAESDNSRDLPKVTFLAEAEGRSRRSKTFGFWPKAEAEAEGIKIGIFL